jgi:hypothetical protein
MPAMDFAAGVPLSRLPRAERRVGSQLCFVVTALPDGVPSVASKKLHDVIVRRKRAVAGYPQLLARLENAYKAKSQDERQAQAVALMALSAFLVANGKDGPIPIWLLTLASSLTDPNYGKALPSNVWRKVALISLGMKALTMGGVAREEAARQAHRAVKTIGNIEVKTLIHRYDELQKGRVKNREGRHLFISQSDKLAEFVKRWGVNAVAKHYFDLADQMEF